MNKQLLSAIEWLWSKRDQDLWISAEVLTSLNSKDATAPRLSNTESLSLFRFLQKKELIFPIATEDGQMKFIIDKLKDNEWHATIDQLKRPKWKLMLFTGFNKLSSPAIFLLGAVVSPIINDVYASWVKPHIVPKVDEQAAVQPHENGQQNQQPPIQP